MDELTDDQWDYWHALSLIDDWGRDPLADLASHIHNSLMVAVAKLGGKVEKDDFKSESDFTRRFRWEKRKRRVKLQTGREQFDVIKQGCGF